MAIVVFLRGVNVGGHRTFRPRVLAHELRAFDVLNVGAAGTFVVRKPGSRVKFRAALVRKLPFVAEVAICDGRDLVRLATDNPFGPKAAARGVTRFVSILPRAARVRPSLPVSLPPEGEWLVRVIGWRKRFIFGEYRRHMRTITFLGELDRVFGVPVTTRSWTTIGTIVRVLTTRETA